MLFTLFNYFRKKLIPVYLPIYTKMAVTFRGDATTFSIRSFSAMKYIYLYKLICIFIQFICFYLFLRSLQNKYGYKDTAATDTR